MHIYIYNIYKYKYYRKIEMYIEISRNALYLLRDDPSIIIKEADKGSAVVVWDREDYLRDPHSQLSDKNVYREVKGDA